MENTQIDDVKKETKKTSNLIRDFKEKNTFILPSNWPILLSKKIQTSIKFYKINDKTPNE